MHIEYYEIICICKDIVFLLFQLEGKVISIPGKLEEVKVKLDKQEKVHDQIIQLKPQRNLANSAKVELDKIRYVLVSRVLSTAFITCLQIYLNLICKALMKERSMPKMKPKIAKAYWSNLSGNIYCTENLLIKLL